MNLNNIKRYISENLGLNHKFKYIGARNQVEEFYGYINAIYPAIFTIIDENNVLRSFSYNDVIIKILKIIN